MKARMVQRIMTDGSEVWEIEMWQGEYENSMTLNFTSFKRGQEFINKLKLLMMTCTIEQLFEEELLLNQPHC